MEKENYAWRTVDSKDRRKMVDEATVSEEKPDCIGAIELIEGPFCVEKETIEESSVKWIENEISEVEHIIHSEKFSIYNELISLESKKAQIRAMEGKIEGLEKKLEVLNETRNRLLADAEQQKGRDSYDTGRTEPASGNRKTGHRSAPHRYSRSGTAAIWG